MYGGRPIQTGDETYALNVAVGDIEIHTNSTRTEVFSLLVTFVNSGTTSVYGFTIPWSHVKSAEGLAALFNSKTAPYMNTNATVDLSSFIVAFSPREDHMVLSYVYPTLNKCCHAWITPRNDFTCNLMNLNTNFDFYTRARPYYEYEFTITAEADALSHINVSMPGFVEDCWDHSPLLITVPVDADPGKRHIMRPGVFHFRPVLEGTFTHANLQLEPVSMSGRTDLYEVMKVDMTLIFERVLRTGLKPDAIRICHNHA